MGGDGGEERLGRVLGRPVGFFQHEENHMFDVKKVGAALLALTLLLSPAACGDDEGEDEIGDGEINDEGD